LDAGVSAAVAQVGQNYVDIMKKDKMFNTEAQKTALKMAKEIV